jgi:hypothetical protein
MPIKLIGGSIMLIMNLPSRVVVPPSPRSVNKIIRELKVVKFKEPVAITKTTVLGKIIKAFRKKKVNEIDNVDSIWGVYLGDYALVYLKYEHVPGGITPCKVMFSTKTGKPLCSAPSLVKLLPMIAEAVRERKKNG